MGKDRSISCDLILLRHPLIEAQAYGEGEVWGKIIRNAIHYLKPNGIILIVTYLEEEKRTLINVLSTLGLKIVLSEKNEEALLTGSSHNRDSHILIAKKVSPSTSEVEV